MMAHPSRQPPPKSPMSLDHAELHALRPYLLRFARLQLRDAAVAEDAVSETLLAVLEHPERFAGQSALRTYLVGILKHKIIDALRSGKREVRLALAAGDDGQPQSDDDAFDALFTRNGHYQDPPSDWGDPERAFERREFFEILQLCVDRLPARTGRIFMMREWLELDTKKSVSICRSARPMPGQCSTGPACACANAWSCTGSASVAVPGRRVEPADIPAIEPPRPTCRKPRLPVPRAGCCRTAKRSTT